MKIVALDIQTLFPDAEDPRCVENNAAFLAPLSREGDETVWCRDLNLKHYGSEEAIAAAVKTAIRDADAVITNKVKLNKSNLNPGIKMILVSGTGTNNICFADTDALGIPVRNCTAYGVRSVVQHTVGLILSLVNNITASDRAVRAGEWNGAANFCLCRYFFPLELEGATLGIVGPGAIGRGVAAAARALGMRVLIAERKNAKEVREGRTAFGETLAASDVITLHCPLSEETRNLIGAREFALMKPGAYLVNVARGGVVDEEELCRALISGRLAGAATDVLAEEPPGDNVLLRNAARAGNLIVTPHIAWGSLNARLEIIRQLAANLDGLRSALAARGA